MIVAGVDPALDGAGVGVLVDGALVHHSTEGFADKGAGYTGKNWQLRNRRVRWTARNIRDSAMSQGRPNVIVMEEHPYGVKAFGNSFDRSYLWGLVYGGFDWLEIPIVIVHPGTHKAWVTGKAGGGKDDIIAMVADWYGVTLNDDEADAVGFAVMGAHHYGEPLPFTPKPRHTKGAAALVWPELAA